MRKEEEEGEEKGRKEEQTGLEDVDVVEPGRVIGATKGDQLVAHGHPGVVAPARGALALGLGGGPGGSLCEEKKE